MTAPWEKSIDSGGACARKNGVKRYHLVGGPSVFVLISGCFRAATCDLKTRWYRVTDCFHCFLLKDDGKFIYQKIIFQEVMHVRNFVFKVSKEMFG